MKNVFDTLWEEQLCRIHVEQEIFQSQVIIIFCLILKLAQFLLLIFFYFEFPQMNQILTLRAEVKHLATVAQQLEPYIKSLSGSLGQPKQTDGQKIIDNQQVILTQKFCNLGVCQTFFKVDRFYHFQEMSAHSQQLQSLLDHINMLHLDSQQKFHSQTITSPTGPGKKIEILF